MVDKLLPPLFIIARDDLSLYFLPSLERLLYHVEQQDIEDLLYEGWDSTGLHFEVHWVPQTSGIVAAPISEINAEGMLQMARKMVIRGQGTSGYQIEYPADPRQMLQAAERLTRERTSLEPSGGAPPNV